MHDYGDAEVKAVVEAAYLEMLARAPSQDELAKGIERLASKKLNADSLRRELMAASEFKETFGDVPAEELHHFRVKRWFDICDGLIRENGGMPSALELYQDALTALSAKTND